MGITYVFCDCGSLPVVEKSSNNATVQGTYPVGYAVRYTCNAGHEPDGTVVIVCGGGGWQGELLCREVYCPAVNPPDNGKILGSPSYKVGSFITFECYEGYELKGSNQLLCRTDLQFDSSPPVCKVKMCPEFGPVENGRTFQENAGGIENDYGSVIKVTCNSGYIIHGTSHVMCQADGTWSNRPTCKGISCPPFQVISHVLCDCGSLPVVENSSNNATVQGTYPVDYTVRYKCNVGHEPDGTVVIVCGGGGWIGELRTLYYMTCSDAPNTRVAGTTEDEPNVCQNDGTWQFQEFACYCSCNMTNYDRNTMKIYNLKEGYLPHGEILHWLCNPGCTKNTTNELICVDGNMTMPQCDCHSTTDSTTSDKTDGTTTMSSTTSGNTGGTTSMSRTPFGKTDETTSMSRTSAGKTDGSATMSPETASSFPIWAIVLIVVVA
ncbi:CFAH-like protein [Mya arenaria]|uniref:CFAH-like protein n=1 Tax=Mya arenaria TaxID=6604 RepID=A0ABY7FD96_MYAAR|nr:CFAH-like protein [Mya arenaria]